MAAALEHGMAEQARQIEDLAATGIACQEIESQMARLTISEYAWKYFDAVIVSAAYVSRVFGQGGTVEDTLGSRRGNEDDVLFP